ncbi:hypothetical protein UCDDS831_g08634 [Diplodia seriata]|uniref:Uncharacterized protein n=1 Tax=Diplodia seriata TaxID=420778 RepID=A0A0G2DSY2_9PEZI|nr:hypothetical protein UCDDS831_g08634 [Diplodia seriata]
MLHSRVTVNKLSGQEQDYTVLGDPTPALEAWSDAYLEHCEGNVSEAPDPGLYDRVFNITTSYGVLFMDALSRASSIQKLGDIGDGLYGYEDLNDMTFNFRDPKQGLNLDFTSYAMFSLAKKDPKALLNASAMEALANKTFSTFFQHFVSSNLSMDAGSWVYQPIGAQLPPDTGPLQWNGNLTVVDRPDPHPLPPTNRTAVVEVSTPVEMLRTNAVAVWLSVAILIWLVGTTVLVAIVQKSRSKRLLRNVEDRERESFEEV